jgi:hypothetical protein
VPKTAEEARAEVRHRPSRALMPALRVLHKLGIIRGHFARFAEVFQACLATIRPAGYFEEFALQCLRLWDALLPGLLSGVTIRSGEQPSGVTPREQA